MNPIYRFFIQLNEDGAKSPVNPVYKDDLALEYELETNQRFYRAKLSGKLDFVGKDYDLINNAAFDTTFITIVEKTDDYGLSWSEYYKGKFMKTDCTINDNDKIVTVQPEQLDEYNAVLAGIEKEYNLIELKPQLDRMLLKKRPLIQMYVPGDNIVSCFLGGMNWEQDVTKVTDDQFALTYTYYFALCNILKEIVITSEGSPSCAGLYIGRMSTETDPQNFSGRLTSRDNPNYYIEISQKIISYGIPFGEAVCTIKRSSDDVALYQYTKITTDAFDTLEFDFTPVANIKVGDYTGRNNLKIVGTGINLTANHSYKIIVNDQMGGETAKAYINGYPSKYVTIKADNPGVLTPTNSGELMVEFSDTVLVTLDITVEEQFSTGKQHADMKSYNVYARCLCDVADINGLATYTLPYNDIVDNNRNYRRVIGYAFDVAYISNNYSDEPTEYGRADNDKYFAPPYLIYGQKFYPIAQSTWRYASLWFAFWLFDDVFEENGRKTYILRDTYPLASMISVLLKEFAPGITHEPTPEYSQFFYGNSNPISGDVFRIYATQKTNILNGEYQNPAQKAPITLQYITNMLRDVFRVYWYIEDGKFKLEHVLFFKNGGAYNKSHVIGVDLTKLKYVRNGKTWGFDTSEYSFDKVDMAERYQFEWMDDVTTPFAGYPIEIKSKYVTEGKIEEINVSNFTSDIDLMLLNPGIMSDDGFALFAAVPAKVVTFPAYGYLSSSGTDGNTSPTIPVRPELTGINATLVIRATGGGTGRVVFYSGETVISTQSNFVADGGLKTLSVNIPSNATAFGFVAKETISVEINNFSTTSIYELPFSSYIVDDVQYFLQNGLLAFVSLQPNYWVYDLPAYNIEINKQATRARGIERKKKQTLTFPVGDDDPDPMHLVKTYIGDGEFDKISINLCSRTAKVTLKYDTE